MTKSKFFPANKHINDYLYYGYLFPPKIPDWLYEIDGINNEHYTYSIKEVSILFDKIADEALSEIRGNNYCIVPISGGWDSRLLLGAAIERLNRSQIRTFSFGTPGQLDFEIGCKVAQTLGVEHYSIDLGEIKMEWNLLEKTAREAPWTKPFDSFFNRYCIKQVGKDGDIVLSGFMGDPLAGSHMVSSSVKKEIISSFVQHQNIARNSSLLEKDYDPISSVPNIPQKVDFNHGELLDFGIRQAYMVAPIVTPMPEMKGWGSKPGVLPGSGIQILTPFADPAWASYWISVPFHLKENRKLFFEMLKNKYPGLNNMPAKDYYGATKKDGLEHSMRRNLLRIQNRLHLHAPRFFNQSNKMMNYLDFDDAFRSRDDYRAVLKKAISFIQKNSMAQWIDFDQMWEEHMTFKADHSKSFKILIGLALNVKVNNDPR